VSSFTNVTRNTLYQVAGKAISIVSSLIITGLLTRHLSTSGYGQYTIITTIIIMLGTLTDWGTGFIAVRTASQGQHPPPLVYGNLLILRLTAALLSLPVIFLLNQLQLISISPGLLTILFFIVIPLAIKNATYAVFQTKLQLLNTAIIEAFSNVGFLGLVLMLITRSQLNLFTTINALFWATLLACMASLFLAYRLTTITYQLQRQLIIYLLREALPMGALLFVFNVYNRLDIFILQKYHGDAATGIYGLAYKVHDNLVLGAAFFMNALYPLISQAKTNQRIRKLFRDSLHLMLFAGALITGCFLFLARPVILILAPDYLPAITVVRLLMIATFFAYLNHVTGYTLAALGHQRIHLKIALLALITNLIANFIFIPRFSYYAAALTTGLTEAIITISTLYYLTTVLNLKPQFSKLLQTIKQGITQPKKLL
jgi:O-antigen/teichoic acid export membrane protein